MRAREPDRDGFAERDGVKLAYEVFGDEPGRPTVVLLPTWQVVHSRHWKAQVPYLARHFRVVTFDGRGTGRSSRPAGAAAYTDLECAADVVAVLDATGTERAVLVALSCGVDLGGPRRRRPPRPGRAASSPSPRRAGSTSPSRTARRTPGTACYDTTEGWAKYNRHYWLDGDYDDFVRFFFGRMFSEPHSTKQIEDCVGWAHEIEPATLVDATAGRLGCDGVVCASIEEACAACHVPGAGRPRRRRPHPHRRGRPAAGRAHRRHVRVARAGSGHGPHARDPVRINALIRDFVESLHPPARPGGHDVDPRRCRDPGGRSTCPPPSASGTPGATSPSPGRCAPTTPTCRSTGSRRTR